MNSTRIIMAALAAGLAYGAMCEEVARPRRQRPSIAKILEARAKVYCDGGLVLDPSTGVAIRIVTIADCVPGEMLQPICDAISRTGQFPVRADAAKSREEAGNGSEKTPVNIYLSDSGTATGLLVAPEEHWAAVNVAALKSGAPSDELFRDRLEKEIWRALAYAMGGGNSQIQPCVMRDIEKPSDLDKYKVKVASPDPLHKMMQCAARLGLTQGRRATYRQAVKEGWAPAPLTDIQRKIKENPDVEIEIPKEMKEGIERARAQAMRNMPSAPATPTTPAK